MTGSLNDLEKDIEASRARLDETIDKIQGRLTVSSIVDEMLGNARKTPLSGAYDGVLAAVRRNPVPVLLITAGVGWLLHRMSGDVMRDAERRRVQRAAEDLPVLKNGADRTYDPDQPTRRSVNGIGDETQI
ncbi:hypothetical protein ASG40_05360 [Methylobacterium sp. Leaf399]|uniref:DUF3618 domain-containing protein n=1 Tax=unclassified Methylobacterium TaxID=2615210 RepID=UPI000700CEC6|nr:MULTISPECIES: DUF3618 domain-containing protein [unclassified Methylobacterium]KQP51844.1 hypothetical protein ASF39_08765 [Methylobacterium sp. Leaf108]KQT14737.1 hypothetical protein ASG40_05360 [Methylobacterium sp. Leaf399]KQT90403.1 hypothetical protein ASG59_00980 [Methylobacterium sp. Leaf466]